MPGGTDGEGVAAVTDALASHPTATRLGVTVVAVEGSSATLALVVTPSMVNGLGVCHGGVIATLADVASIVAAGWPGLDAVATGSTIDLLAPAHEGDRLTATGWPVHRRGRNAVCDVRVERADGTEVALVRTRLRTSDRPPA